MSSRPNFLFIFPDQHRPDWLGVNPDLPLRTPNIDALCKRGIRFTNAYTPSPICAPARACLATGRDYVRCGVIGNEQDTPLDRPNYYRSLREAGYEVCGVGKFDLHKPTKEWGLDGSHLMDEYGFTSGIDNEGKGDAVHAYKNNGMASKGPYMHYLHELGLAQAHLKMYDEARIQNDSWLNFAAITELPDEAYCDNWVANNALQCLEQFETGKPWHLVINFTGPHDPYDVTSAMRERWQEVNFPPPVDNDNPEEAVERRQNYAAMIENIDNHVGRFIEAVQARGELENTIIIYASDHGEMLGDHGRWQKSVWHTPSAGIPMIIAGPGAQSGVVSQAVVSLHDLAATFIDYADARPLPDSDSISLRPVVEGRATQHRTHVFSGLDDWNMVFDGHYKYVSRAASPPLLYDLIEDPSEMNNLGSDHPSAQHLSELLQAHLEHA